MLPSTVPPLLSIQIHSYFSAANRTASLSQSEGNAYYTHLIKIARQGGGEKPGILIDMKDVAGDGREHGDGRAEGSHEQNGADDHYLLPAGAPAAKGMHLYSPVSTGLHPHIGFSHLRTAHQFFGIAGFGDATGLDHVTAS